MSQRLGKMSIYLSMRGNAIGNHVSPVRRNQALPLETMDKKDPGGHYGPFDFAQDKLSHLIKSQLLCLFY